MTNIYERKEYILPIKYLRKKKREIEFIWTSSPFLFQLLYIYLIHKFFGRTIKCIPTHIRYFATKFLLILSSSKKCKMVFFNHEKERINLLLSVFTQYISNFDNT